MIFTYIGDERGLQLLALEVIPIDVPEPRMPLELLEAIALWPTPQSTSDIPLQQLRPTYQSTFDTPMISTYP